MAESFIDRSRKWHLQPWRSTRAKRRRKPLNHQDAELRAKEHQTMAFFMIVAYFTILAEAVFS